MLHHEPGRSFLRLGRRRSLKETTQQCKLRAHGLTSSNQRAEIERESERKPYAGVNLIFEPRGLDGDPANMAKRPESDVSRYQGSHSIAPSGV